jgi:ATP-dependent DNA ligase
VLVLAGQDVMDKTLDSRKALLGKKILPKVSEPIRYSPELEADLPSLIAAVKQQGFEGLVAKRRNSRYEPGLRTGAWRKMRVNQGQELVIANYTPSPKNFDALVIGYYEGGKLIYAARTRNGFTPTSRAELFKKMKPLETAECPFANLPEKMAGRWGAGLTAAKMAECRWLTPQLVAQFEYVEWTPDNHLRHTKFVALREDKKARDVRRQ